MRPFGGRALGQPPDQPLPLALSDEDRGEVADRPCLDQGQRLEQLVQRAVAPRADHEGARVAYEHDLAREEVAETQADVHVGVELLLVRQLDVAADRQCAHIARAPVGGLHQPAAAPGDHRVAATSDAGPDLSR